jgi:hypothetical protein
MKPVSKGAILALLIMSASACNRQQGLVVSHPPTVDLNCPAEPDVVALLRSDPTGVAFDAAVRQAGQDCRDALARVCRWHKQRGLDVTCPLALAPQP